MSSASLNKTFLSRMNEGRKEMFYLTTHSTHLLKTVQCLKSNNSVSLYVRVACFEESKQYRIFICLGKMSEM